MLQSDSTIVHSTRQESSTWRSDRKLVPVYLWEAGLTAQSGRFVSKRKGAMTAEKCTPCVGLTAVVVISCILSFFVCFYAHSHKHFSEVLQTETKQHQIYQHNSKTNGSSDNTNGKTHVAENTITHTVVAQI